MNVKTVAVTGGGTGGHIYPAVAIAHGLRESMGDRVRTVYLGSPGGMENRIVPAAGIEFFGVRSGGFLGKGPTGKMKGLIRTAQGTVDSLKLLGKLKPDLVVGTGGYVTLPVLLAAYLRRIPVVVHEQNAWPGLANRIAARFAVRILATFEESRNRFSGPERVLVTGLPVRPAFHTVSTTREASFRRHLLVTGGSQGASPLNRVILRTLPRLMEAGWSVTLITGQKEYRQIAEKAESLPEKWMEDGLFEIYPYADDMERQMAKATLVMGRAGASFMAETTLLGIPALLVPFPESASDHQRFNARAAEKMGAAVVLEQADLNPDSLMQVLDTLTGERLDEMSHRALTMGKPGALQEILEVLGHYLQESI